MFDPLQKLLPVAAQKYGFGKQLKAIEICHEYERLARKILPARGEQETKAKSYEKHILTISVANSAWAQEVQIRKHEIQSFLNEKFQKNIIEKIRIEMTDGLEKFDNIKQVA